MPAKTTGGGGEASVLGRLGFSQLGTKHQASKEGAVLPVGASGNSGRVGSVLSSPPTTVSKAMGDISPIGLIGGLSPCD